MRCSPKRTPVILSSLGDAWAVNTVIESTQSGYLRTMPQPIAMAKLFSGLKIGMFYLLFSETMCDYGVFHNLKREIGEQKCLTPNSL